MCVVIESLILINTIMPFLFALNMCAVGVGSVCLSVLRSMCPKYLPTAVLEGVCSVQKGFLEALPLRQPKLSQSLCVVTSLSLMFSFRVNL